ncbi:MAG: hypothetical protein M0Q44_01310 [Methylobacter sp.]|jgi:hypothetical protein|nr:hypothetical protein [Methylobacter sp.]
MQQPPLITYNLQDRGRQFRGRDRKFNIKALMESINGGATQERVKSRGMLGYYGHLPRNLAGLEPVESMVNNGKYNEIEPAIVTTYLEAFPDGTVKHQTEFLDSVPGRKAAGMFAQKIGGFSSAIDQVKPEMFGFDYVLDPNYLTNRGFTLDSAGLTFDSVSGDALTLDQVIDALKNEEEESLLAIIEQKNAQIAQISAALDSVVIENEQYLSMLASGNTSMVLDSVGIAPLTVSLDSVNRLRNDTAFFNQTATLPGFIVPKSGDQDKAKDEYDSLIGRIRAHA